MNLISWIKGKFKQREVRNLKPDDNFEFKQDYYGILQENSMNNFKFVYCNNYTDKLYKSNKNNLSFISCKITLPNTNKVLKDAIDFMNIYMNKKLSFYNTFGYKQFHIENEYNYMNIYIRGDLAFYNALCENIHNNIITKYIRTNIFPDGMTIETPNEYLNNIYNSIINPYKEIDILFIEEIECKELSPVIGLSVKDGFDFTKFNVDNYITFSLNNRHIIYTQLEDIEKEHLEYIIENVKFGNKLLDIIHKGIDSSDIYSDIDEIIEE